MMKHIFGEQLANTIELFFDSRCAGMNSGVKAYMIGVTLTGWHLPCGLLSVIGATTGQGLVVLCQINDGDTFIIWSAEGGWL